jgi:hypothetical protein
MPLTVSISSGRAAPHESASITLADSNGLSSSLYMDFTTMLRSVRTISDASQDFLLVASTAYALDKLVPRSTAPDGWTRAFEVCIPVTNHKDWKKIAGTANECLSFLSGDNWKLEFVERDLPLVRRRRRQRRSRIRPMFAAGKTVCLFSGGLDSLVGAIDWLEQNDSESLTLVGHHDPAIGGPLSDQKSLRDGIAGAYSGRLRTMFVGVGHSDRGPEITMRSRSILFIALGLVVADYLGEGVPLLIPENGTIALNVPLTPSRRGSCSTRTAHPYYLELLRKWLIGIGLDHPLENPLVGKTKGEMILLCLNRQVLDGICRDSVSCAKRGHKRTWINKRANGCGRCMPCIYRRAAMHAAGIDDETYGVDVCQGEVDWTNPASDAADDLRACLSFLSRNPARIEIAKMLMASGRLAPLDAIEHAGTVQRAMDEIRNLLTAKGTSALKQAAGLGGRRNAN